MQASILLPKLSRKVRPGDSKLTRNQPKLRSKSPKITKMPPPKKISFFEVHFFSMIFWAQKKQKKDPFGLNLTASSGGTESAFWIWYHNASSSYELLFAAMDCYVLLVPAISSWLFVDAAIHCHVLLFAPRCCRLLLFALSCACVLLFDPICCSFLLFTTMLQFAGICSYLLLFVDMCCCLLLFVAC